MSGFGGYGKRQRDSRERYAQNVYQPEVTRLSDQKLIEYHRSNLKRAPDLATVTEAELRRRGLLAAAS